VFPEEGIGMGETLDVAVALYWHHQVPGVYPGGAVNPPNNFRHCGVGGEAIHELFRDVGLSVAVCGQGWFHTENSHHR